MTPDPHLIDAFIARWSGASGNELANYQLFLTELIALLDLPRPDPASADTRDNAYVFERRVQFSHGDGSSSGGRIDLYNRGHFVCEAKKVKAGVHTRGFDLALMRARSQAEEYARALPADEGRPPFLLVVDVGHTIDLYAEFSRSGATYTPFPDPASHRIRLADLHREEIILRLRAIWLDPVALDPTRVAARVTRAIAGDLAELARSLERTGLDAETVAGFLTRCLFTLFAEDVELLPRDSFKRLLAECEQHPAQFVPLLTELWRAMDVGGFSVALRADLLRFNGKLFKQPQVLALDRDQIALLARAARHDWKHVEPAIFGTLLERALDPTERHALGAHYTPRAYVERLVLPTVIEPLRADWTTAQAAALTLLAEGDSKGAINTVRAFHHQLCHVRVLDPACGSGNFLYVTLEHMKRLEGEVLNRLTELGDTQGLLDLSGVSVDPHQFLGIEINPRAAAIAEMVLWIGHLQWHFRTRGHVAPPQPVLKDFHNIECRDAVLAHDGAEIVTDEFGKPVTRWDGRTMKAHPVTGEPVPDDSARIPLYRYKNPRKAEWPAADFVVGNPPFIGKTRIRAALGDGYVEALRAAWSHVPDSADLVMYWWDHAAALTQLGALRSFGLITTNSMRQAFNRRVVDVRLSEPERMSLKFVVPDHPWVEASDGAAVRISMTVGVRGNVTGRQLVLVHEVEGSDGTIDVVLRERSGRIHSDLSVGANIVGAAQLIAARRIANTGVILGGRGFVVKRAEALELIGTSATAAHMIHPLRNGEDLLNRCRDVFVIDPHGREESDLRQDAPSIWQLLHDRVLPERITNRDPRVRERWWLFRRTNEQVRAAISGLHRYIVTVETAKHRIFQFLDGGIRPEHVLVVIGLQDAVYLGILSSRAHTSWALAAGGTLEDRPRYNKTRCFETFPFPAFDSDPHPSGATRQPPTLDGSGNQDTSEMQAPSGIGHQSSHAALRNPSPPGRRWPAGPDEGDFDGLSGTLESDPHPSGAMRQPPSPDGRGIPSSDPRATGAVRATPDGSGNQDTSGMQAPSGRSHQSSHAALRNPSPPGRRWPAGPDEGGFQAPLHENAVQTGPNKSASSQNAVELRPTRKPALPSTLLTFARQLRKQQTDAETKLWFLLRDRRFLGLKFRRQVPMQAYILDFYCHELRLAVELDGGQHNVREHEERDKTRTEALATHGVAVVRFWNDAFLRDIEGALEALYVAVQDRRQELGVTEAPSSGPAGHLLPEGEGLKDRIGALAEQLDAHRKRQQAAHAELTLTGMYNVLEKLKAGEALSAKEKLIHEHGLVSVLKQLHDELDLAVLAAYGWSDLAPLMQAVNGNAPHPEGRNRDDAVRELDEALLERLVALNAERAAEEARGLIRWLRPEFQNPGAHAATQAEIDTGHEDAGEDSPAATPSARIAWPKDIIDQIRAVADAVSQAPTALDVDAIANRFTGRGRWRDRLPRILDTLVALGNLQVRDAEYRKA